MLLATCRLASSDTSSTDRPDDPEEIQVHETHRLSWDGAVDADGHILEPSDLWENYLEPQYRDRALRVVKDENGLDELEIGGQRSTMSRRGFPSTLAAMGRTDFVEMAKDPDVTYDNHAP